MISHLGKMLSLVVGGTWAARRAGEEVFGLAVIGDGGTSTGEFHEALNIASVRRSPVLFLVENNHYAFSTPTSAQYRCRQLSDRAAGYGITGRTIDGTDPWEVYAAVSELLDAMREEPMPAILECMTLRLQGHAAYDKGLYVPESLMDQWRRGDPLPRARQQLQELCGLSAAEVTAIDDAVEEEVQHAVTEAMAVARPKPPAARLAGLCPGCRSRRPTAAGGKATDAAAGRRGKEWRRRPAGLGIYPGQRAGGLSGRAGHRRLRLGVQDLQGARRSLRAGAGDRHAAVRVGHGRLRPGGIADRRPADHRVPIRRFLDRSRHATRPERRHLVSSAAGSGAAAVAIALRRRTDPGGLPLRRVRGPLVAVPRAEAALSGHAAGDFRVAGGRLPRPQPLPGLRAQAALLEPQRATSISTAIWRPSGGRAATSKAPS